MKSCKVKFVWFAVFGLLCFWTFLSTSPNLVVNDSQRSTEQFGTLNSLESLFLLSSDSRYYHHNPSIAMDEVGTIHAVWEMLNWSDETQNYIIYRRWNKTTGIWTPSENISKARYWKCKLCQGGHWYRRIRPLFFTITHSFLPRRLKFLWLVLST